MISQNPVIYLPLVNYLVLWSPAFCRLWKKRRLSIVWELGVLEEVAGPCGQSKKEEYVLEFGFCVCLIILGPQNVVWLSFLWVFFVAPSKILDVKCSYCCTVQIKWAHRGTSQSKALAKTHGPAILLRQQSTCSRAQQKSSGNIFQLSYYDSKSKFWTKDERPALNERWATTPVFWVHLIFTVTDRW